MSDKRIVILGGTGFVGRHLVPRLIHAGFSVRVLSRNRAMQRANTTVPGMEVVNADVYDRDVLCGHLQGAVAAINLVGILNERGRSGAGFHRAHVELTQTLIAACKAAGVNRLVQMSALNAGRGKSHYLRTKGLAEKAVTESGLAFTIFQPSVIFGPGDGLFFRFAQLIRLTPVLPLARAQAKFAPVYVGDVAQAFVTALQRPECIGQTYELYGPEVLTLAEIVRYTAEVLGLKCWVVPLPDALARVQAAIFDFLPGKPFSTDNYLSLQLDSVGGIDGLYRLGIDKTPIGAVIPALLGPRNKQARYDRYRRGE